MHDVWNLTGSLSRNYRQDFGHQYLRIIIFIFLSPPQSLTCAMQVDIKTNKLVSFVLFLGNSMDWVSISIVMVASIEAELAEIIYPNISLGWTLTWILLLRVWNICENDNYHSITRSPDCWKTISTSLSLIVFIVSSVIVNRLNTRNIYINVKE